MSLVLKRGDSTKINPLSSMFYGSASRIRLHYLGVCAVSYEHATHLLWQIPFSSSGFSCFYWKRSERMGFCSKRRQTVQFTWSICAVTQSTAVFSRWVIRKKFKCVIENRWHSWLFAGDGRRINQDKQSAQTHIKANLQRRGDFNRSGVTGRANAADLWRVTSQWRRMQKHVGSSENT